MPFLGDMPYVDGQDSGTNSVFGLTAMKVVSPKKTADQMSADTEMGWYEDSLTRYRPIENLVISMMDPSYVNRSAAEASVEAGKAFDGSVDSQKRQLAGLGMQLSPEQKASMERRNAISRSKATAGSFNTAQMQGDELQSAMFGLGR